MDDRITFIGDDETYDDGKVLAVVSTSDRSISIQEFTSRRSGNGNARAALEWMREKFGYVHVSDPGNPYSSPNALAFWTHMAEAGLVDEMCDEYGDVIYAGGKWLGDFADEEWRCPAKPR